MQTVFKNLNTAATLILMYKEHSIEKKYYEDNLDKYFHTIAWNRGEKQEIIIDNISYIFEANTIIPLMLNQTFKFSNPEDIFVWQFNREFYCIVNHDKQVGCVGFLFFGPKQVMFIQLNEIQISRLEALFNVFLEEFDQKDDTQEEMLRVLLVRLIIQLTRIAKKLYLSLDEHDTSSYHTMREFSLLVEHHFKNQHQVKFYADLLHKSPKTIANIFALHKLKSPSEIIQERIIIEAKRLFNYTDLSVKEISAELGFIDSAHFSKFFKNITHLSPTEFRRKNLLQNQSQSF
jgi:AraC family transcriptional regulator, transcriptional activator of pobA